MAFRERFNPIDGFIAVKYIQQEDRFRELSTGEAVDPDEWQKSNPDGILFKMIPH
jgi:hypothetical protein